MNTTNTRWRIGFDIGGTFTDFILYDAAEGTVRLHKRLTTPHDPSEAALIGLEELVAMAGITPADAGEIIHGTTLVTNTVIERTGAKLGLITTRGFRDLLEMGTEQRYDIYDLFLGFPQPLVPRDRRLEVAERMDRDGRVVEVLDEEAVRAAFRALLADGVEAVGVCFLHSYRNPAHEQAVGRIAREEFPELAVSLSAEVVAEMWEYQRCVTTCANAYVQPLMDRYLKRLERELAARGFAGALRLMHSAGGLVSPATARAFPIRLLESGPAGGGLATALFGDLAGQKDVISFDMGGTTAKACMVEDGRVEIAPMLEAGRVHRFSKGSGLPIKAPVIDMIEIGAGGGSIAGIDEVGLLKVGPHSAGSDPGPACYGMGGTKPTVTDANLVLGYYDPGFFLGGRMALDKGAAERAVASVAAPLGLGVTEAAWGIHKVVVESMAAAARVHLVEKGKDPRAYAMVGFGGAGPAHAADVARALGVREVIIPPASGAASALGFLAAPLSFELVRSLPLELSEGFDAPRLNALLAELEAEGRARLAEAGVAPEAVRVERSADMRLVGQMHDIAVALPAGEIGPGSLDAIRDAFTRVYAARFTSVYEGARMEAINFRVRCIGPEPKLSLTGAVGGGDTAQAVKGTRRAWFEGGWQDATVYDRYALAEGDEIAGPAIIEEREATTIVPPGDAVRVDATLNLRIAIAAPAMAGELVTAEMPLAEAMARIEADPIALEIMWSRLVNVVEEMWLTVVRTAFSLIVSESQDFACELLDPTGETLAHSPRAMPVFNLTLPRAVKALLAKYPAETMKPGDVLITNDPWLCAGHLFDIAVVTPVFREGKVVGLMGTVGHVSDIGGTKDSLKAREIFEEGLQIPPMKLFDGGVPNEGFFALFRENVRNPDQVLGDLHSFVAANALGGERLLAFMRDYGMSDLRALAAVVQGRSEKAMRDAISALPDGDYFGEIRNNPMGQELRYPLRLTVAGDAIHLDFDGAPPQLPQGGLNSTLNYTAAHATYPLKCMLTPNVRGNAGCYRPFTVEAPEGSILNPRRPAAVNMRTRTGWYLAPNIFRALSDAAPGLVQANTGLPVATNVYGQDASGRYYSDHLFIGGGQGASSRGDGKSGLLWPTSASNTSIELFETRAPVLVVEKSYVADTGGAGQHRGGLGQRVRMRKLLEDGRPALFSVYPEGVTNPIDGLFGGCPGSGARGRVLDLDGNEVHDCGNGEMVETTGPHEVVEVVVNGGSGYGDPAARDPAAIERDLRLGLITEAAAQRDYGWQPARTEETAQ
ncbi:hydantoinase B/oxoprolinase family protein [Roseomonas sp. OT10]|uniref:hydantoinase B/oxoprolinase family protein n=1 Tax=Roseomonas cutis TaxID=2897332 RepID=UPI001E5E4B6A|nr:hydantoinase B/oxoprolinase family protein [Roseomonas sp. OT10]UFN49732.1 hydantoinase B/oxoprolinase family protein [Roseomonas sp. OT10]